MPQQIAAEHTDYMETEERRQNLYPVLQFCVELSEQTLLPGSSYTADIGNAYQFSMVKGPIRHVLLLFIWGTL